MATSNKKYIFLIVVLILFVPNIGLANPFLKDADVIPMSFAKKGISLDWVAMDRTYVPAPMALFLVRGSRYYRLKSIRQFHGLVAIKTKAQALEFVQLRTSRQLCYYWPAPVALEIVDKSKVRPSFNDKIAAANWDLQNTSSGSFAVLSAQAYALGGFSPPTIRTTPSGYVITRWVCRFNGLSASHIERWRESVSSDGDYHCKIIKSEPLPKLPGTHWVIWGLM